jgi:hypothetical protein
VTPAKKGSERLARKGKKIEKRMRMEEGVNRKEGEEVCKKPSQRNWDGRWRKPGTK